MSIIINEKEPALVNGGNWMWSQIYVGDNRVWPPESYFEKYDYRYYNTVVYNNITWLRDNYITKSDKLFDWFSVKGRISVSGKDGANYYAVLPSVEDFKSLTNGVFSYVDITKEMMIFGGVTGVMFPLDGYINMNDKEVYEDYSTGYYWTSDRDPETRKPIYVSVYEKPPHNKFTIDSIYGLGYGDVKLSVRYKLIPA